MTFIEVMVACILGQLILGVFLGMIKGLINASKTKQQEKVKQSADELLASLTRLQNISSELKERIQKEKEGHDDE